MEGGIHPLGRRTRSTCALAGIFLWNRAPVEHQATQSFFATKCVLGNGKEAHSSHGICS